MKRLIIACCAFGVASALVAAEAKKELTPEEKAAKKAEAQRHFMEATGGFVTKPGEGKVAIVNCQKKFDRKLVAECVDNIREQAKVCIELIDGDFALYTRPAGYNVAFYIADDPKLPPSVVAVEAGWGMMNIAELGADEKLFVKQFNRAAALTFSAGVSKFTSSVMQPSDGVAGLKKIVGTGIPMDVVGAMRYNLRGHGVTETVRAIYRQAIAQGWAPQPTNDAQRVIWEQMHAEPTKPMTIQYKKK